jgi:hypothetical protein
MLDVLRRRDRSHRCYISQLRIHSSEAFSSYSCVGAYSLVGNEQSIGAAGQAAFSSYSCAGAYCLVGNERSIGAAARQHEAFSEPVITQGCVSR